ncbi:MAG TPA: ParM/StbA family protein [Opitutaceae bacterium]|nr:ParM/StbA family protein [Opitutaceae bacterium]
MLDVAVDIGSGITKARGGEARTHFASLAGVPDAFGHEIEASTGATVNFAGKTYVTGERAHTEVRPENIVNTRDDAWYETEAYIALLYSALARVVAPGYEGRVALCTGLPQALFTGHKSALAKRLARKHRFEVNGKKYSIHLRSEDVRVLPQVTGLFLSRLELDRSLQHQKVAVIDVGTYTSDWTIVDNCRVLHWSSGGAPVGIGNVIEGVRTYLREEHRNHCSYAVASEAVRHRKIRSGGRTIELTDHIDKIVFEQSEKLMAALKESWGDAKDSKIIIGGGGCHVYAPAIRSCLAHAEVIQDSNPIFSVVDGYHIYMHHARKNARQSGQAA